MSDDLKVSDVVKQYNVARQTVWLWIVRGWLPNAYQKGRTWRIPVADVDAVMQRKGA